MRYQKTKPFVYVDLVGKPQKKEYVAHDKFDTQKFTGVLDLEVEVVSDYLFVGSGNYDLDERRKLVYYSFFRTGNRIAIPGTSIKGAVRSVAEAISNSCISVVRRNENYSKKTHDRCKFDERKNLTKLCPACRLFGTTGYGGRVSFKDAQSVKVETEIVKIGELFLPRISKGKRKFYQNLRFKPIGNLKREKNYRFVEAVKKGSKFVTSLSFQNVERCELSLLLYSMGIYQNYTIKIGGAKPRCFGIVKFIPNMIRLLTDNLLLEEKHGNKLEAVLYDILEDRSLIEEDLLNQYRRVTMSKGICPQGVY